MQQFISVKAHWYAHVTGSCSRVVSIQQTLEHLLSIITVNTHFQSLLYREWLGSDVAEHLSGRAFA